LNLEIPYDVQDSPTLGKFLSSDAFVRLVMGPVGSGKSSACCVDLLLRAQLTPLGLPLGKTRLRRSRFAVIRNTYRELEDTTRKTFESWVPPVLYRWQESEKTCVVRFNDVESELLFRALDQPQDVKKLLSLELTGAYINEMKEVPKGVFDMLQTRVGRYPAVKDLPPGTKAWAGVWGDTNPPDADHWLYRLFEEEAPEGFELFRQPGGRTPLAENLKNLREGYYQQLVAGKDPLWVKVMVDGEYGFVVDGRPIYPEFRDHLHVSEFQTQPRGHLTLGMDFGLTPAAVYVQRDERDGQVQVVDETTTEDMGAVRFAQEVGRVLKTSFRTFSVDGHGDPAGEQRAQTDERTPFDIVRAAGLPVSPAPTNDFTLRREAVAGLLTRLTMLGRPALVIHPRCKVLRKAMQGGYCYRRLQVSGEDRFHDQPEKNKYSHVAEALQYAAVGMGEDRRAVEGMSPQKVTPRFKTIRSGF
jgi:hypothetical protein